MKTLPSVDRFLILTLCLAATLAWAPVGADSARKPATALEWMDRGALLSSYGNYDAAIESYRNALALSPEHPDALFQMGVCYGELRLFDRAIAEMNRAIALRPGVGAYFYGRGRVYLLSEQRDKAMADFTAAGDLGHPDAKDFLERQAAAK